MIPKTETDGVVLEGDEPAALARRLMAQHAARWADHIDWDDVPELAQGSWSLVADAMDKEAAALHDRSDNYDGATDIDSRFLWESAL